MSENNIKIKMLNIKLLSENRDRTNRADPMRASHEVVINGSKSLSPPIVPNGAKIARLNKQKDMVEKLERLRRQREATLRTAETTM